MQDIVKLFKGLLYFWSWNCSILGGYLFFIPFSILNLFSSTQYRKCLDLLVTYWQYYITTLLVRQDSHVYVTGDPIDSNAISIVISNHRTRVDWNFIWAAMYHAVEGKNRWWCSTKFVLKNSIKNIPCVGWVMQMAMYIFIKRNWEKDKICIDQYIQYVEENQYKHILILFPEGTDLTPKTKTVSDKYATANGLPKYKHVLHPRSTGFVYLVQEMRAKKSLDAVYDLTLIYPDECPQNEEELFVRGKFPHKVMAHLIKYPVENLPEDPDQLKQFLEKRWQEKEQTIDEFKRTGNFLYHGKSLNKNNYLTLPWAYFTNCVWIGLTAIMVFFLTVSKIYFYTVMIVTLGYIFSVFDKLNLTLLRKAVSRLFKKN